MRHLIPNPRIIRGSDLSMFVRHVDLMTTQPQCNAFGEQNPLSAPPLPQELGLLTMKWIILEQCLQLMYM